MKIQTHNEKKRAKIKRRKESNYKNFFAKEIEIAVKRLQNERYKKQVATLKKMITAEKNIKNKKIFKNLLQSIKPEKTKLVVSKTEVPKIEHAPVVQKKEPKINFTTVSPRSSFDSTYGGWVDAYQPVNKGKLGSIYGWREEDKDDEKKYYEI
jgi:hypothetical protein